jgi:site-specific DNA recombinase
MTVVERLRSRGVTPRAVLYARFSSDNQREESIEAQLRAMHEYCSRNSIVIIHEYCDRAKSATTDDRPEFLKMIAASREGNFDFAIVHKLDRFSRNRYDSAYYKRELKKNGVQLLSVLEQMDDSPESIILESVLEGMSEYYSKNLAREVMKGMRESAMDCRYIGGWIPYGFRVDPQTHRYIINDYEAEAVRMIFRDVADGCGYNVVLNKLNSMGYRTRLGNTFSKETLYEMLRNEKYNGVYVFSRAASKDELGRRNNHLDKPIEDQIRIPGGMPKIVDDETFARVQAILTSRKRHGRRDGKRKYLLTGMVFCGLCGHRYCGDSMQTGGEKNRSVIGTYFCNNRKNHGAHACSNSNIHQEPLEELVLRKIEEIVFDESRIPGIVQAYRELCQQEDGEDKEKIRTLRQNLKTVEQKIANIVNIIANTGSAALVTQLTQLEREKELLDVQIQEEERDTKENDLDEEAIRAAFRQAQKMFHSGTLPQMEQIINLYLDKVLVYPDYVEIHLNNVPTNLLNPSQTKDEPALGGLHTFYIEKMCEKNAPQNRTRKNGQYGYNILVKLNRKEQKKAKSRRKGQKETRAQDGLDSSKTGGAEGNRTPVRKQLGKNFSGRSLLFAFPFPGGNKHPTRIGSFIMRGMGKAYHTHVLRLNHTRARVSGTPGADGRLIRQPGQQ